MWDQVHDQLMDSFLRDPGVCALKTGMEEDVRSGETTATLAARRLLESFTLGDSPSGEGTVGDRDNVDGATEG
jgi:LAO/AO transport system kinase